MWATKANNAKEEENEDNKELVSGIHDEEGKENFSGNGLDVDRIQLCPSVSMMKEYGALTMLNDRLNKLTKTVEQFIDDMTTWKKNMDEDAKFRKVELKNYLEMQNNTVKSYLSMKNKISAIETRFEMVYGKKCFDRKE